MIRPADPAIDEAATPARARSARALVQAVRWRTGLSQADFARVFMGIWLSPKTSEPAMREQLLAGAAP